MIRALATAALIFTAPPVMAQEEEGPPRCVPIAREQAMLTQKYQESIIATGLRLSAHFHATVVTASDGGATWTILDIDDAGCTTVVAAGTGWLMTPPPKPGTPD